MSFASLGLVEPIMRAVAERGYTQPTPIQAQAIPAVLAGGDLMAGAQTGTGKTAGFTLPILHRLATTPAKKPGAIRVLVLTPTRELAAQVEESVREYGKYLDVRSMVMFGGVSINPQITALRRGVDILVATPGRLLDHVQQKTIDLSSIEILVLDEADRMLDMGFIRDIKKVLALLPKQRQNLLFSATFSDDIKALADGLLNRPAMIEVARRNATTETVGQQVMVIEQRAKRHLLAHLIREKAWFQVLVFTRTKHGANRLAEQLAKSGIPALAIHGNKSQNARTRALAEFKDGSLQVLVATDIAARGLDIVELPHVVNFELPNVPEDYVHRIGRTGRAGATGEALSLVAPDEMKLLADIEKFTKRAIPRADVPAFDLPPASAEPAETREPREPRGGRQGRGGRSAPAPRRAEGSDARAPKPRRQRVAEEVARSQTEAPRARRAPQARDGQAEARPASRPEGRSEGAARRGRSAGQGAPRDGGAGAGRARQGRSAQDAPRSGRGEANGNVFPSDAREVNGNVIAKARPDADGNRARGNRPHDGRREAAPRQDAAASGGIAGVFKRGLNALRRFGES